MQDFLRCTKPPVVIICAPTACGKTDLAYNLFSSQSASIFANKAEIISADSQQVYKGMDIGTAKPDKSFLQELPHHLIDVCEPNYQFGAGDFVRYAKIAVQDIIAKNKLPVIVGGTAFYIKNFLYGLPPTPQVDEKIRLEIEQRMNTEGAEKLMLELQKVDSISAEKIHINDEYRIKRALEVYYSTGKPRSEFIVPQKITKDYNTLLFCLDRPRSELYERVEKRVDIMFDMGLETEIQSLKNNGFSKDDPGMQAIGYREFFTYDSINEIKQHIVKSSKEYVKRQQTFFKTFEDAIFVNPEEICKIEQKIIEFLGNCT